MKKFLLILILIVGACSSEQAPNVGLVLPHHLLVEDQIDEVYESVSDQNFDKIVIISPNHFGYGFNSIQTNSDNLVSENLDVVYAEPENYDKEHGIYSHYGFIDKYFAKSEVLPITIKPGTHKYQLDKLISGLRDLDLRNTLIIASIDFTHQIAEVEAVESDKKVMEWMTGHEQVLFEDIVSFNEGWSEDQIAIDSPESLYVLFKVFEGATVEVLERTSSADILGFSNGDLNTSHIFARLVFDE